MVLGSPLNALLVQPPFREYHLIDLDGNKIQGLRDIVGSRQDVVLHHGNCNEVLLQDVFPRVQYKDFRRGLCLLDPYKLTLDWKIVREAGAMQTVDIFINFPIHDINRTLLHHRQEGVSEANIARMNSFWGDESWNGLAYDQNLTLLRRRGIGKSFECKILGGVSKAVAEPGWFQKGAESSCHAQQQGFHGLLLIFRFTERYSRRNSDVHF